MTRTWLKAAAAAGFALALALWAHADVIDPSLAHTLHAGAPRALAAAANLDSRASGLSPTLLPTQVVPSYRAKLQAPIQQPPAADAAGALIVAHGAGKLSQLDDHGRVQWTVRLGPDAAACAPIITSDGTRWVLTVAGEVVGVDADGRVRARQPLPGLTSVENASAIPLVSGAAALASGRQLLAFDRQGVIWLAQSEQPLGAVLERHAEVIAVSTQGRVLRRGGEGQLVTSGELGGHVDAVALLPDGDHVVAIVDRQSLVELDLRDATRRVLFEEPTLALPGALAVGKSGEIRLLAGDVLIGLDSGGKELFRPRFSSSTLALAGYLPDPLIDARGYTAVTLPDAGLAIVTSSGEPELVPGSACPEPLRPTPIGKGKLALSCRSGLVFAVSGKAP